MAEPVTLAYLEPYGEKLEKLTDALAARAPTEAVLLRREYADAYADPESKAMYERTGQLERALFSALSRHAPEGLCFGPRCDEEKMLGYYPPEWVAEGWEHGYPGVEQR